MSLTDLMSGLDLAVYPQVALVIFLVVFVAVSVRAWRRPSEELQRHAALPTDEGLPAASQDDRERPREVAGRVGE